MPLRMAQLSPTASMNEEGFEPEEEEIELEEDILEEWEEEWDSETESTDPDTVLTDPNPLNSAGTSLDRLIEMQFNEDVWSAMLGDLPCLDVSESCVQQLQSMAIGNSLALQAIDERVELVNAKIDEARANNQRTINLGIFEPALQYFLRVEDLPAVAEVRDGAGNIITPARPARRRGFLDRVGDLFSGNGTLGIINDVFSLIGVPLFRNATGGDAAAQQRQIAIADLQVKVAEIENKRGELANQLRERVILEVLDFDQIRREFQISQEISRRETLRLQIIEQNYRFAVGTMNTPQYLAQLSALDERKANTFRSWARLRSQLTRIKLLVLGSE
jgi:hypothetical protein